MVVSRERWLLGLLSGVLLMFLSLGVEAMAQEEAGSPVETKAGKCQMLQQKLAEWQKGEPWSPSEGGEWMSHHKLLLGAGGMGLLDEYLSPIGHRGLTFGLALISDLKPWGTSATRGHIYQELLLRGGFPKNSANGSEIQVLNGEWSIGPAWRLLQYRHCALDVAPLLNVQLQGEVKPSNSNNYANMKASAGLDAWLRAHYQLPSRLFPLALSYSAQVALLHATFHPSYGQSYFEYIAGDHRTLPQFHPTWLGRELTLRQRFLLDLPIRHCTLTLGAEYYYQQQRLSHTRFRQAHWGIVLGISFDSLMLSGQRSLSSPHISNSLYQ